MIQLVPATEAHARALRLRQSDIKELTYKDPQRDLTEALLWCLKVSKYAEAAVTPGGEVVAIFGMALLNEGHASPWMLCAESVAQHGKAAIRLGRTWLSGTERAAGSRLLFNWIAKDNTSARRFITRLGFRILPSPDGYFDYFYLPQAHV